MGGDFSTDVAGTDRFQADDCGVWLREGYMKARRIGFLETIVFKDVAASTRQSNLPLETTCHLLLPLFKVPAT
jgi:hypothetical protein